MANWLEKIVPRTPANRGRTLPAPLGQGASSGSSHGKLPNASVVYGVAASVLIVVALVFLMRGHWFTALIIMLPAVGFLGFALHFIKHHQQ